MSMFTRLRASDENTRNKLTPEILQECLAYSPSTGRFFYKPRDRKHFVDDRSYAIFHTRFSGKEALHCLNGSGYLRGTVNGIKVYAHIAAWAITYGEWPKNEIDHINGDPLDNRIENLRDVTHRINNCNRAKSKDKSSRYIGVCYNKHSKKKWKAQIRIDGQNLNLGHYDTEEDAAIARMNAQRKFSQFHDNHGKRIMK